jgi:hypothetical protein
MHVYLDCPVDLVYLNNVQGKVAESLLNFFVVKTLKLIKVSSNKGFYITSSG